jgi:hypothetical protein
MRRDNLDVLNGTATVAAVVLNARVRKLNVSVLVGQLAFLSPSSNRLVPLLRGFTPLAAGAVLGLQEPLIFALQILFENDPAHRLAALGQALGRLHVRAVDPGIVGQLARLGDADVKGLSITLRAGPSRSFEDVSPMASKRYQRRSRASDDVRDGLHKAEFAESFEIAGRTCWCPRIRFSQLACGHHAERSDCRKNPDVVTRQSILLVVHTDSLP